jgi:hypothetical protein
MDGPLFWGDVATWVTGLATIALFVIGFLQIRRERLTRIKSEKESETRQLRVQAELISSWIAREDQDCTWMAILNNSPQPVYDLIMKLEILGAVIDDLSLYSVGYPTYVNIVPPGLAYVAGSPVSHGMMKQFTVGIGFRDAAGRNWIRRQDGKLASIGVSPLIHFKIDLPIGSAVLQNSLPPNEISTRN